MRGEQPLVSALIPAYGRPIRTQRAIDSVSSQSHRPLELILVDDGSSPPLERQISLPRDTLERVRAVRHEENRGANAARNTALDVARGDYLALLDSDDEWLPAKVERQVAGLEASGAAEVSYTGYRLVDADGRLNSVRRAEHEGDVLDALLRLDAPATNSVLMLSRSALEAVGGPSLEIPGWQDWEWYLRLAARFEFDAVREPMAVKHGGGERLGRSYRAKRDEAHPIMRETIRRIAESPRQAQVGLAYLDFRLGYTALVTGHYREARQALARAVRGHALDPSFYLYLAAAGPHYPWLRRLKRRAVRALDSLAGAEEGQAPARRR